MMKTQLFVLGLILAVVLHLHWTVSKFVNNECDNTMQVETLHITTDGNVSLANPDDTLELDNGGFGVGEEGPVVVGGDGVDPDAEPTYRRLTLTQPADRILLYSQQDEGCLLFDGTYLELEKILREKRPTGDCKHTETEYLHIDNCVDITWEKETP